MSSHHITVGEIRSERDRALACDELQALAEQYRARTMPNDAQFAFDQLAGGIEAYDAQRATAKRDMSASYFDSVRAAGAAFQAKRGR